MFKILDKRNGEVTAEQQAVFNKISTNNADGYVDGFLNSLRIAKMSSNVISIDSGLLSIQGFRSVNDTLTTYTVSVTPSEPIPFQLVATYSHFISDENDTLEITTRPTQELRREPLFSGQNAVYEVELAEFNMTADGIADFKVTLEKIVYNEQDLSELLDKVTKAEQDSSTALEKVNELETQVIEKQGTAVYVGGTAQSRVNFTSDPQLQITANRNAIAEAQSDISDIENGTTPAGNANKLGGVDAASYALKNGTYSSLTAGGNTVLDTRKVNSPPSYYANQKTCYEFKSSDAIGLAYYMPSSPFVTQTKKKGWVGSNYIVYQEAVSAANDPAAIRDGIICYRYGINNTWGEWKVFFAVDPTKLAPATANGWTQTTTTGTLPSVGVYMVSFDIQSGGSVGTGILFFSGSVAYAAIGTITGAYVAFYNPSASTKWLFGGGDYTGTINAVYYKRIA